MKESVMLSEAKHLRATQSRRRKNPQKTTLRSLLHTLNRLHRRYHRPAFIAPDPLEVVLRYRDPRDQEVAGLVSALLAYGGVQVIVRNATVVLDRLGPSPAEAVRRGNPAGWVRLFRVFRHRWTTGTEIAGLLRGMQILLKKHGSLNAAFLAASQKDDDTVLPALRTWASDLVAAGGAGCQTLVPDPAHGSACKRLFLYLRWMVRHDAVDPGAWSGIPASRLIVPLDVHMHRAALHLRLTRRRAADLRTALEVTAAFRRLCPEDPVRWDFALTRAAMRGAGPVVS